jgi:hypothetical protein
LKLAPSWARAFGVVAVPLVLLVPVVLAPFRRGDAAAALVAAVSESLMEGASFRR